MKSFHKEVPILNDEYKVVVCIGNEKFLRKILKKYHYPDTAIITDTHFDHNRGLCLYRSDCYPVVALPRFPKKPDQIATLIHESIHAIEHIFQFIGQPLGGEIFAHSVSAVIRGTLRK